MDPNSPNFNPPQSPLDIKPDAQMLINSMQQSPSNAGQYFPQQQQQGGAQGQQRPPSPSSYPPLSGSKHFCSICGDRASGKHYGVYSCEGCKGFFKRTVRKELTYACRENRNCTIDKRQRNRCQYCRYMKCLSTGMRREAVQEERHRSHGGGGRDSRDGKPGGENEVESTSPGSGEMPLERILEAENIAENGLNKEMSNAAAAGGSGGSGSAAAGGEGQNFVVNNFDDQYLKSKMLRQLVEWAKHIPRFADLKIEDQVTLIRAGWNELLIAGFSFRSMSLADGIVWGDGQVITRENAHMQGVGEIYDRVLVELVGKMKELRMDKSELGCLRAIILFNPDAKGLESGAASQIETYRDLVYTTLEEYCRMNHENEPSRFAKLLLRLPALRSIGLKCVEHLFFYKLIKDEGNGSGSSGNNQLQNQQQQQSSNSGNGSPGEPGGSPQDSSTRSLEVFIKEILED